MAGTNPSFNAQQFREGITFAMQMGLPPVEAERPTFYFRKTRTYPEGTALDQEGRPLNPNVSPIESAPEPVQVNCAVEFSPATADEMPVGAFHPTKATLTLLDGDFELVRDAVEVALGGDRYVIAYRQPPLGMFEVGIYQLVCFAREET